MMMAEETLDTVSMVEDVDAVVEDEDSLSDNDKLDAAVDEFDLRKFMDGIQPGRVAVRLYSRSDLQAQIMLLQEQAFSLSQLGKQSELTMVMNQIESLKGAYFKSHLEIVLEERSKAWQARKVKELKSAGISNDKELKAYLVAEQIIEPVGISGDMLLDMAKVIPSQIDRLMVAFDQLGGRDNVSEIAPF